MTVEKYYHAGIMRLKEISAVSWHTSTTGWTNLGNVFLSLGFQQQGFGPGSVQDLYSIAFWIRIRITDFGSRFRLPVLNPLTPETIFSL